MRRTSERTYGRAEFELQAFERLSDVFTTLLGESSLETMLDAVADALDAIVPNMALLLFRMDPDRDALLPAVARGTVGAVLSEIEPSSHTGLIGRAVSKAEAILANDAGLTRDGESDALVVAPLVARSTVWGCLVVYRLGAGAAFTDAEFRFVTRFSDAAALALENEETRSRLRTLALTDELTGVLNRRGFYGALDREVAQARRTGGDTSVLVVDLDNLKGINDAHGHDVGDAVLARFAQLLAAHVRAGDVVARMGGDEFAVCLPATDVDAAREVAAQLEEMLDSVVVTAPNATIVARATIGVATVRGDSDGLRAPLREADLAMYARKASRQPGSRGGPAEPGAPAAPGYEAISGV